MIQSRLSVQKDFPKEVKVSPRVVYIGGQPEWVDNLVTFGDLIEESMGKEARDFYFESIYDLMKHRLAYTFVDIDAEPVIPSRKAVKNKSQDEKKRLF